MKPTRLLLADDHAMLRAGIRVLVERIRGITVVGEAADGRDALNLMASTHPDVVMLDIAMPELNGLEALSRITRDFPKVKVIILTMHSNEEYVIRTMRGGAAGFLLKNAKPEELEHALESVVGGQIYLSPSVGRHVADYLSRNGDGEDPLAQLTQRQREILQLVAEGRANKEIAGALDLGIKTVEMHRTQLMQRLDIHDVAGLVRHAIRTGLVSPER